MPIVSYPRWIDGSVHFWIGVGASYPASFTLRYMAGCSPASSKLPIRSIFTGPSWTTSISEMLQQGQNILAVLSVGSREG